MPGPSILRRASISAAGCRAFGRRDRFSDPIRTEAPSYVAPLRATHRRAPGRGPPTTPLTLVDSLACLFDHPVFVAAAISGPSAFQSSFQAPGQQDHETPGASPVALLRRQVAAAR